MSETQNQTVQNDAAVVEDKINKQSFEKDLSELEKVVAALEKSDISLDEMLALFEKGIGLTRSCTNALDSAEQKITVLMRNRETGKIEEQPFAPMTEQ